MIFSPPAWRNRIDTACLDPADRKKSVKEDLLMENKALGTVKWFSRMKGWGFIEPDGGDKDVFVHYASIAGDGFRNLEKGERVRFLIEDTPKGPRAIEVSSVEAVSAL
jgi:CspA family cold shock protein